MERKGHKIKEISQKKEFIEFSCEDWPYSSSPVFFFACGVPSIVAAYFFISQKTLTRKLAPVSFSLSFTMYESPSLKLFFHHGLQIKRWRRFSLCLVLFSDVLLFLPQSFNLSHLTNFSLRPYLAFLNFFIIFSLAFALIYHLFNTVCLMVKCSYFIYAVCKFNFTELSVPRCE